MIISPWIFYLISLIDNLLIAASIFLFVGICLVIMVGFFEIEAPFSGGKKIIKKGIVMIVISALMLVFTPSKDICYEMLAASYITEDNISKVGNTAENLVDYIIEKIEELQEQESD